MSDAPPSPGEQAPALALATTAQHRLLAWPNYRSEGDLDQLAREFAPVLAGRSDACLCLRHQADLDPPLDDAMARLQAALERTLGPSDVELELLVVDDQLDDLGWTGLSRAVTAVLSLPSTDAGERARRLRHLGLPLIENGAALQATLEVGPSPEALDEASARAVLEAAPLLAVGAQDRALRLLAEQINRGAQSPELLITFAHLLALEGAGDRAIDILGVATKLHPGHALLHLRLAQLFQQTGQLDQARASARRALDLGEPLAATLAGVGGGPGGAALAGAGARPRLSVVVVAHELVALTARCLEALYRSTREPFELVLVDNGGGPGVGVLADQLAAEGMTVRYLRNASNEGFARGANRGLAAASGDSYLAVVHTDVVVSAGWFERLTQVMASGPDIGIAVPMLDNAQGDQRWGGAIEEGTTLDQVADPMWRDLGPSATPADRVSSACMLIRRAVVDQIGGFDPIFGQGFGSDADFCLRARRAGHQIAIADGVLVHHDRHATFAALGLDPAACALRGWERFCHKWNLTLTEASDQSLQELIATADNPLPAEERVALDPGAVLHRDVLPLQLGSAKPVRFLCVLDPHSRQWEAPLAAFLTTFSSSDPVALVVRVEPPTDQHLEAVTEVLTRLCAPQGDAAPEVMLEATQLPPAFRGSLYTAASAYLITGSDAESILFEREAQACGLPLVAAEADQLRQLATRRQLALAPAGAATAPSREALRAGFAALVEQGQLASACQVMQQLIAEGDDDWRNHWTLAQTAARCGRLDLVDASCAEVLKRNPEFWFAREAPKHARGYYSQLAQDRVIEDFFKQQPPRHKVFVEVGAFDGRHYSNVRRLVEQAGWTGVSIEPVEKNFQKLAASYAGLPVHCVRAAVGPSEGEAELNVSVYPHLPDWGSDVASLKEVDRERWAREYGAQWKTERVPVRPLDAILRERGIEGVDVVSIDCEGADFEVLTSLDLKRHAPALLVVEYGRDRQRILDHATAHGYSLLLDNQQDLFLVRIDPAAQAQPASPAQGQPPGPARPVALAEARKVLNPHLFTVMPPLSDPAVQLWHQRIPARDLLTPERLDVVAKLIYARLRRLGVDSDWGLRVYRDHLHIISPGLREGDGTGKSGLDGYLAAFHRVLEAVAADGLDPQRTMVPVGNRRVFIDGGHRVAASLLHDRAVDCLVLDWKSNSYGSEYFARRGLAQETLDALALEYGRLKPEAYMAMLFPVARGQEDQARAILAEHGRIVHEKQVRLSGQGPARLVQQIYRREKWVGTPQDGFRGARYAADQRFAGAAAGRVRVFMLEATDKAAMRQAKERIRALYGVGNNSIHITDTHAEAREAAGLLFNANSLHMLNHAHWGETPRFWQHLALFRTWLEQVGFDPDHFAIDGSAIMSAYGLRDAQDLDFLHFGHDQIQPSHPMLSSHNTEMAHHAYGRDQIIFDPAHHFFYEGIKFGALHVLRAMKARRDEGKDRRDVTLMDAVDRPPVQQPARPTAPAPSTTTPSPTAPSTPSTGTVPRPVPGKKLVAMVPARNEEQMIGFCLRALSRFVDAIVFLDDFSDDRTLEIVSALASECRVERILTKDRWFRDEPGDRRRMLEAAREIGGTHLISIDADEALTANGLDGDRMRNILLSLEPGDSLEMLWICLWRSLAAYRLDKSVWSWNYKAIAFADDGRSTFDSEFIHTPRVPPTLRGRRFRMENYEMGLLHFQFVNWENLKVKQAWYRCLERVRDPAKPVADINDRYAPSVDERGLGLTAAPANWYANYDFLDPAMFAAPDLWRKRQVREWFDKHGQDHFADLEIWDVDWQSDDPAPLEPPTITASAARDLPPVQPPVNLQVVPADLRERVLSTVSCHDCDDIAKAANAGQVIPGEPPVQIMHNGLQIVAGCYGGEWMTEVIRCLRGHHEPQEELVFHEVLKRIPAGATMIELGASWAYYSLWFQRAVPGAVNHLIEPNATKIENGRRNFQLNGAQGTFTHGFIGPRSAPEAVFTDWDNTRTVLPAICIDDYMDWHGLTHVHILHSDIQGAEVDMLRGAARALTEHLIDYIFISTHGDTHKHQPCLDMLRQHGYRIIVEHTLKESVSGDGLIAACSPRIINPPTVAISRLGHDSGAHRSAG